MSKDLQFVFILLGTVITGFLLSVLWGRITRPDTFDRDTAAFLAKIWFGIGGAFLVIYFLLRFRQSGGF